MRGNLHLVSILFILIIILTSIIVWTSTSSVSCVVCAHQHLLYLYVCASLPVQARHSLFLENKNSWQRCVTFSSRSDSLKRFCAAQSLRRWGVLFTFPLAAPAAPWPALNTPSPTKPRRADGYSGTKRLHRIFSVYIFFFSLSKWVLLIFYFIFCFYFTYSFSFQASHCIFYSYFSVI